MQKENTDNVHNIAIRNQDDLLMIIHPGETFRYDGFLLPLKVLDGRGFESILAIAWQRDNWHKIKRSISDDVSFEYNVDENATE